MTAARRGDDSAPIRGVDGVEIRPLARADLDALLPLIAEAVPAMELSADDVARNLIRDVPGAAPEVWVARRGGAPVGVAAGALRGDTGHVKLVAVAAPERRAGIAAALLDRVERGLLARGGARLATDGAAPVYLQPGVPASHAAALALFAARGYREVETRRSMTAPLDASGFDPDTRRAEESLAARGFSVRAAGPAELPWIAAAVEREFSAGWEDEVRAAESVRGAGVEIALRAERVVAFAVHGLWARNAFGPMGTAGDARGEGLGAVLLRRSLASLRRSGHREAVISWVGPEPFYRRIANASARLEYRYLVRPPHAASARGPR